MQEYMKCDKPMCSNPAAKETKETETNKKLKDLPAVRMLTTAVVLPSS